MDNEIINGLLGERIAACPECGQETVLGTFKIMCDSCIEKKEQQQKAAEQQQKKREIHNAYESKIIEGTGNGTLTPNIKTYRFKTAKDAGRNAESWNRAKVAKENLYLYGTPGTGKTHLARCLLNRAAWYGNTIAEGTVPAILRASKSYTRNGLFLVACEAQVMLIDDIDKMQPTKDNLLILWEVLDARCSANRRTIVTSNLPPAEVSTIFRSIDPTNTTSADATLNRLRPVIALKFEGESLR